MPPPFPTLETNRLVLREIADTDAPALFRIHGDADLMRWFGSDPVADIAGAHKLVKLFSDWRSLPNPGVRWGVQVKGSSEIVGSVGLFAWNRQWRKCTVGYELCREAQGHGYMREALNTCLAWGFEHMELNRIEALVHPANQASINSVSKLGFAMEGVLREVAFWCGEFHDMRQYSLLRRDWLAVKPTARLAPT